MALHDARKKVSSGDGRHDISLSDAISNIESYNSKSAAEEKAAGVDEPISQQLGIKDDDYTVPVEDNGLPHVLAIIAMIGVPAMMIIGSFIADGLKALINWRMLLVIPTIAILYVIVRATKSLGRVYSKDIEKEYPELVVIDGTDDSDDPKRPQSITVRTDDEANATFTVVLREDWDNDMAMTRRHQAILVVKDKKAAVMVEQ